MQAEELISRYGQIEMICFIMAAAFLAAAIFLFFFFKIPQAVTAIRRQSVPDKGNSKKRERSRIKEKSVLVFPKEAGDGNINPYPKKNPEDSENKTPSEEEPAGDTTGSPQEGVKVWTDKKDGSDDFRLRAEIIIVHDR